MLTGSPSGVRHQEIVPRPQSSTSGPSLRVKPAYIAAVGLFALILVQYFLFRSYAGREATWAHPTAIDQSVYLLASYEDFEKLLTHGFFHGTWDALSARSPNGVMLPLQAAILYLFLGPGRLSAFTLLFLYFVLSEI